MADVDLRQVWNALGVASVFIVLGLVGETVARDTGAIDKLEKDRVNYSDPYTASPFGKGVGKIIYRCDKCIYFKNGNACRLVEGEISPSAGCDRWLGWKAERY